MSFFHSWDQRYLRAAKIVASWSKDPSTQCGAIVVRPDKTIASAGFNGFPRGIADSPDRYNDRLFKYPHIIHSEWNALMSAKDASLVDCSVYAWPMPPCHECTGFLAQKKISRIVAAKPADDKMDRWSASFDFARSMAMHRNIAYKEIELANDRIQDVKTMEGDKWQDRFLTLACEVHRWSKDTKNLRGAVIVRRDKTIASLGFNGFAQGLNDDELFECPNKTSMGMIPAEINALLFSKDHDLTDSTVYSWPDRPTIRSVVHLIQQGVKTFVCPVSNYTDDLVLIEKMISEVGGRLIALNLR